MDPSLLLQRIRRDRRKLLEFVLSSGPAHPPTGAAVDLSDSDLDTVSVDHVLDCVQSGGVLDISEANKKFFQELDFPITINSSSGNLYFLLSEPESSGSPPQRVVPPIGLPSNHSPCSKERQDHLFCREMETEIGSGNPAASLVSNKPVKDANTLSLGLPALRTGLSDDDMRETAYEVLLSSLVVSGGQILLFQETKHEKKPRFLMGLKSKRDGLSSRQPEDCHSDLLDIIRIQMEISEALDVCIKQGLRHSYSGMSHEQIDVPQISLVLLSTICKSDFSSEILYTKWQKRQANVLEELLQSSANLVADGHTALSFLLTKLRNTKEWALNIGPKGCSEMLRVIKRFASRLSSMSGKFGIPGETYYWTSSYHFNIRLYEKLLSSVFDVLEDDQVIEEADEILAVFKLTRHIFGISQRMHDALYGWVLFQKDLFIANGQGLPSVVVEKEARLAQQIIDLYALKADSIIEMLMSASEQIVHQPDSKKPGSRCAKAADTLLRVLCHKMDGDASKFLKIQYQLPKSSDYEDVPAKEYTSESPSLPDILKKGTSFNWLEKGQRSFRVMMKKFQEATSEIRQAPR